MPICLYNTLTKKKEVFVPLDPAGKHVNIYTCGVTVYEECHIGHARSLYVFDVIRRYLQYREYDVRFVRNITDVDDKIIQKANDLGKTANEVSNNNIDLYDRDLKSLGIEKAVTAEPRATENIPGMIEDIKGLMEKGFAYAVDGDVYFHVRQFHSYGKLSGQSIEKMLEAVRIEKDSKKKDPLDFALWKKSEEGDPSWESPWGPGRPGWHIECSAMSLRFLKCQTLDIHAGGRDLIFPHHENEIAQAEALTGSQFAKYWIHHGLLTINGHKMAKSLGNFITIREALKKYSVDGLKMFFLFSHYASDIDFNDKKMEEAQKALDRFDILFWKAYELFRSHKIEPLEAEFITQARDKFIASMENDFNTPEALSCLFDLLNQTNKLINLEKKTPKDLGIIYRSVDVMETLARNIFGLFLKEQEKYLSEPEKALLKERQKARVHKDFKKSDDLRGELKKRGIVVEDSKAGQTWRWA